MSLLATTVPLAQHFDVALVDLDGTAYKGSQPIEFAATSLNAAATTMAVEYVTNNASRSPQAVAAHLIELGIDTGPEHVLTAALAGAAMLPSMIDKGERVLIVGGQSLVEAVTAQGFEPVRTASSRPAAVLQGFHPSVDWSQLAEATYALRAGAAYVATNLDTTLPTERGFAPGNGSLVQAVVTATGVVPRSPGKPASTMFRMITERGGYRAPLAVGDRLNTDIAGANAAGYPSLMVLTGVNSARDAVLAIAAERPSFISVDLRGLLTAHAAPVPDGPWWELGTSRARIDGDRLELHGDTTQLDSVKVAAAAVWAHPGSVDPASVPEFEVAA